MTTKLLLQLLLLVQVSSDKACGVHMKSWRDIGLSPPYEVVGRGGGTDSVDSFHNLRADLVSPHVQCPEEHKIVSETILHDNWRRLINRRVRLPGRLDHFADFEIVSQRGTDRAVLIFVWYTDNKTTTLLREYMPSVDKKMYGLAAGMVEDDKHRLTSVDSPSNSLDVDLVAAQHELDEECRLKGGIWHRLCDPEVVMDKYSTTKLIAFLVIDPEHVPDVEAKPRDETEVGMEVVSGVSIDHIQKLIWSAEMTVVGSWASLLAIHKLRELGEIS